MKETFTLVLCQQVYSEKDTRRLDSVLRKSCPANVALELHLSEKADRANVTKLIHYINTCREDGNLIQTRILQDGRTDKDFTGEDCLVLKASERLLPDASLNKLGHCTKLKNARSWLRENVETIPGAERADMTAAAATVKEAAAESKGAGGIDLVLESEKAQLKNTLSKTYMLHDLIWAALLLICWGLTKEGGFLPGWLLPVLAVIFALIAVSRLVLHLPIVANRFRNSFPMHKLKEKLKRFFGKGANK